MNKLYLSIKKSIDNFVSKANLSEVECEWESNQMKGDNLESQKYPLVLFKVQSIVYNCPEDKFPTGEMAFSVKVIFEGKPDGAESYKGVKEGFTLLSKLPLVFRAIESEETGIIKMEKMEAIDMIDNKHCYQFNCTTSYYPPVV